MIAVGDPAGHLGPRQEEIPRSPGEDIDLQETWEAMQARYLSRGWSLEKELPSRTSRSTTSRCGGCVRVRARGEQATVATDFAPLPTHSCSGVRERKRGTTMRKRPMAAGGALGPPLPSQAALDERGATTRGPGTGRVVSGSLRTWGLIGRGFFLLW
jgi:hypothetical protein